MPSPEASRRNGLKGGGQPGKRPKTIARERAERKKLAELALTAERVLEEIALHSFANVQDLFDESGNLKPIQTLTRAQAAAIASLEVIKKNAEAGDGQTDIIHKVKVWDKIKSLEMLAKHFALLTERIDLQGDIEIGWKGHRPDGE